MVQNDSLGTDLVPKTLAAANKYLVAQCFSHKKILAQFLLSRKSRIAVFSYYQSTQES